jgi:hypothetical protein
LSRQEWWTDYTNHLARRNSIIHDGLLISEADAEASLAAVDGCLDWMHRLLAGDL